MENQLARQAQRAATPIDAKNVKGESSSSRPGFDCGDAGAGWSEYSGVAVRKAKKIRFTTGKKNRMDNQG